MHPHSCVCSTKPSYNALFKMVLPLASVHPEGLVELLTFSQCHLATSLDHQPVSYTDTTEEKSPVPFSFFGTSDPVHSADVIKIEIKSLNNKWWC